MAITFNMVELRGSFDRGITLAPAEASNRITLSLPFTVVDSDDPATRLPEEVGFTVGQLRDGVMVAATDDNRCNPPQWHYLLTESWPGGRRRVPIYLPSESGVIDYSSIANAGTEEDPRLVPTVIKRVNGVGPDAAGDVTIPVGTDDGGGGAPTGPAGGVLGGNYPNPTFAVDMATQTELNGVRNEAARPIGYWTSGTSYQQNNIVLYKRPGDTVASVHRCHTAHTASGTTLDFSKFDDWGSTELRANFLYRPAPWAPNVNYGLRQLAFRSDGVLIWATSAHLSAATYDATKWNTVGATSGTSTGSVNEPVLATDNYILTATDGGKVIEVDATTTKTVYIPTHGMVPLPIGTVVWVRWIGLAAPVVIGKSGVTVRTPETYQPKGKWYTIKLHKRGYTEWLVTDDVLPLASVTPPALGSATVNLGTINRTVDPLNMFSYCVSGYTGTIGDIRYSTHYQTVSHDLGPGQYRLSFRWNAANNKPYNGANGGINDAAGSAAWVAGIESAKIAGAKIIGIISGPTSEMSFTPSDAVNIVNYAASAGWGIDDWIIGNEPDLNDSKVDYLGRDCRDGRNYGSLFAEVGWAIKQAQPGIKLWGPAASGSGGKLKTDPAQATNPGAPTQFFNDWIRSAHSGHYVKDLVDVIAWHYYASGNTGADVKTSTLMAKTTELYGQVGNYGYTPSGGTEVAPTAMKLFVENEVSRAKSLAVKYSINEFGWFYQPANGYQGMRDEFGEWYDDRQYQAELTVFVSSVYRNMCRGTNSYAFFFADLVGPLGLYTRNEGVFPALGDNMGSNPIHHLPHGQPCGTPMPSYYGMGMYTGLGLFRRWGSQVAACSGEPLPGHGQPGLEMLACADNGGDIMLINKDEVSTRRMEITITGNTATNTEVWQTVRHAPWDKPILVGTPAITGGKVTVTCPPMTVTRIVIDP